MPLQSTHTSTGSVFSRLFSLAWPIVGINVLTVLALAVDTAMCGRLPHKELALTGLGFATQVIFLLMVLMVGLTVGTVAMLSRAYGSGDSQRVNHILYQSTVLVALVGVFAALVGNLLARPILTLLGASTEVQAYGLRYLRPLLMATPFNYLFLLFAAVFRSIGNTRIPFLVSVLTNLVNVAINYALILGNLGMPALGLRGAAIGTLTSQFVGMLLLGWVLRRGTIPNLTLSLRPRALDGPMAKDLLRVGAPAALDMFILNAAFLSIIGMLGRLNEVAVAAHGIGLRIQALAFVPGMSISQATGALVGQALGASNANEARAIVRSSLVLCFCVMSTLALILVLLAYPIVGIFDVKAGTSLETYAVMWIRLLGYGMPLVGIYIAFVGMLQGAGATNTSLTINFASTVLLQIPLSYLLGFTFQMGVFGVWIAFPLSFLLKASAGIWVYRRGRWAREGAQV